MNLMEAAALQQSPTAKFICLSMFKGRLPSPMDFLPVKTVPALEQKTVRVTDPGAASTRNIGDAVTAYKALVATGMETLKAIENKIEIDKLILAQTNFIENPIAFQLRMYAEFVKHKVNDMFVAGDPVADETVPAGLDYRLRNDALFVAQSVNANGLDVDANDDYRNSWLDYIDQAIDLCGGGAPDICVVNRQTYLKFKAQLRRLKLLDTTRDMFAREILQYGTCKFLNAGQTQANALTPAAAGQIIGDDTATSIFGSATTTPMYFVSIAEQEGAKLLQLHPLKTVKLGLNPNNPGQYVVDVTWPVGFDLPQRFCLSSVQGLVIT